MVRLKVPFLGNNQLNDSLFARMNLLPSLCFVFALYAQRRGERAGGSLLLTFFVKFLPKSCTFLKIRKLGFEIPGFPDIVFAYFILKMLKRVARPKSAPFPLIFSQIFVFKPPFVRLSSSPCLFHFFAVEYIHESVMVIYYDFL